MPINLTHVQKNYNTPNSRARVKDILKHDHRDPHEIAWRIIEVDKEIRSDSFVDHIRFYNDLLIQPFFTIVFWIGTFIFPWLLEWFGIDISFTFFNLFLWIISALQTFLKFVDKLKLIKEYHDLASIMFQWKVITHVNGGPFITGPSQYESLIYADAVARIIASLEE